MEGECLSIKGKTWTRDSHGLFDYESNTVKENRMIIQHPTKLFRKKHELYNHTENPLYHEFGDQFMCNVITDENCSFFKFSTTIDHLMQPSEENINELQNKIWYIIKQEENAKNVNQNASIQNENESFEIQLNDVIKLGRIKYVITDLKLNDVLSSIEDDESKAIFKLIHDHLTLNVKEDVHCLYCLSHYSDNDPLINICSCKDSMCVHYNCVKQWINTKVNIKKNEKETVISYNMKSFNCSICKTPYPRKLFN